MIPCFYLCVDNCDYSSLDLKVGLEIHQQLATNRKLFCKCSQIETDEYDGSFSRKLRISKSELGEYDPAAIFEHSKEKKMIYFKSHKNSCLVEQDEEPPHDVDEEAKKTALIVSAALKSNIFAEIFPMRKMVIDGSNTMDFSRTVLCCTPFTSTTNPFLIETFTSCMVPRPLDTLRVDRSNLPR